MYMNAMGYYVPEKRIPNQFFEESLGLTSQWLEQRTGIRSRSKVAEGESGHTMGIQAVEAAVEQLPYSVKEVDLIISAGYALIDTVGTLAHRVQRHLNIEQAQVFAITSACSSFVNAVEIAQAYFALGKASKALIVCSEENSAYSDLNNPGSGHLWGDAAVAVFISKDSQAEGEPQILDIFTQGLAHVGKGPDGVCLYPGKEGIVMHDGRDVFQYACTYMPQSLEVLLQRNSLSLDDLNYIACHQANLRIVKNIAMQWKMPESRFLSNIQELGNTGSASSMLVLAQNQDKIVKGDLVGLTVFGGGYSSGAMLVRF